MALDINSGATHARKVAERADQPVSQHGVLSAVQLDREFCFSFDRLDVRCRQALVRDPAAAPGADPVPGVEVVGVRLSAAAQHVASPAQRA